MSYIQNILPDLTDAEIEEIVAKVEGNAP